MQSLYCSVFYDSCHFLFIVNNISLLITVPNNICTTPFIIHLQKPQYSVHFPYLTSKAATSGRILCRALPYRSNRPTGPAHPRLCLHVRIDAVEQQSFRIRLILCGSQVFQRAEHLKSASLFPVLQHAACRCRQR